MSKRLVKIELLEGSKVLASLDFEQGREPILVGRSHESAIRVPPEDHTVSGKHVRISWKGGKVMIEDAGSRNGVYADGKRIEKPQKVNESVLYTLGNYRLAFTSPKRGKAKKTVSLQRLKALSGVSVGKYVSIKSADNAEEFEFTIGLDHACDLRLSDPSVSRRHAVLKVRKGGVCWIEDLGSRNGTYVNGEVLKKERLLKNRDKISIAYFEFEYRNDVDRDLHLVAKLAAVAITAAALAIGYSVLNLTLPEAEQYLRDAHRLAAVEQFEAAESALEEVKKCRDAGREDIKERVEESRRKIAKWKATKTGWNEVKNLLASEYVKSGRNNLQLLLQPDNLDGWAWNNKASTDLLAEATAADAAIRLCYEAKNMVETVREKPVSKQELLAFTERLANALAEKGGILEKPYMQHVVRYMTGFKESIEKTIVRIDEFDKVVQEIDLAIPDFAGAVASLKEQLNKKDPEPEATIKERGNKILPVLEKLLAAQKFLTKERERICDMEFASVAKGKNDLDLPSTEDCAVLPKLSELRGRLEEIHNSYLKVSANLAAMVNNLFEKGIREGDGGEFYQGELADFVLSKENWDKVLRFDCCEGHYPLQRRNDPTSCFDKMLGFEYVYDNLKAIPKMSRRETSRKLNFTPKCEDFKALFNQVRTFVKFMDNDSNKEFISGKLARLNALCMEIISGRDNLVKTLRSQSKESGAMNRSEIVAGYYAEYFSDSPSSPQLRNLGAAVKQLNGKVHDLNVQYEKETEPSKRIEIKKQILKVGFPQVDPVRKIWIESEEKED